MNVIKILFILPLRKKGTYPIEEPGVAQISSVLKSNGYDTKVVQLYEGDDGASAVEDYNPEIVASTLYDDLLYAQVELLKKINERFPKIKICIGGYTPSYHGIEVMEKFEFINYAIKGEGELVFLQLLKCIEDGKEPNFVKGLIYRDKDCKIIENKRQDLIPDLNDLPFASRDVIAQYNINLAQITASRGCTGNCSFCVMPNFWRDSNNKRKWRGLDTKRIVDEIEYIVKNHNCTRFVFNDNSFEDPKSDASRPREIAQEILQRGLSIFYQVFFRAGFYLKADQELMNLLLESGLYCVWLGIESGNEADLKLFNKNVTVQDNLSAVKFFRNYDLNVGVGFIHFNPYSTFDRLYDNIDFLEKCEDAYDATRFFRKLIIYKGTKLFDMISSDGLLKGDIFSGGYDFEFVNKKVGVLQQYLSNITQKHEVLMYLNFLTFKLMHIYTLLKKDSIRKNKLDVYNLAVESEREVKLIFMELNSLVSNWMRELTELAEVNWNLETADKICDTYLFDKGIIEHIKNLKSKRNILFFKLLRIDSKYKHFVMNVYPI